MKTGKIVRSKLFVHALLVVLLVAAVILAGANTISARDSISGVALDGNGMAVRSAGPFNIAVVQVWDSGQWAADEFGQLDAAPGTYSYTWAFLPATSLTSAGLAPYNVLIIPESHDYSWLDATGKSAIVAWVNSGKTLIVHNFGNYSILSNDPLMAAFGTNFRVDWTGEGAETVTIIAPTSALLTTPNALSAADFNNWYTTIHNSVNPATAGSAWTWVSNSTATGNRFQGYAVSGSGTIVLLGGDPELHAPGYVFPADKSIPRKIIENEIVFSAAPPVQYSLTVNITGQGTVTKVPDQATYADGTPVQLTAQPAGGWVFNSWGGALSGSTNPTNITMNGNKTVTATFNPAPPNGGVSYWNFNEGSGTSATDSWDGNNGTVNGAAWTTGKVGGALSFNGVGGIVEVPDSANLRITGTVAVEAFFKLNSMSGELLQVGAPIVQKWGGAAPPVLATGGYGIGILGAQYPQNVEPNPQGKIAFAISSNGGDINQVCTPGPIAIGTWYHLVGQFTGTEIQLWVNGVMIGSKPFTGSIFPTTAPVVMGKYDPVYSGDYGWLSAPCVIDEVKIYNRALSRNEIARNAGLRVIDFDTLPNGTAVSGSTWPNGASFSGTSISNQYASYGAKFSTIGGLPCIATDESNYIPSVIQHSEASSKPNCLVSPDGLQSIIIDFVDIANGAPATVNKVDVTLISVGWAAVTATAYASNGAVLTSVTVTHPEDDQGGVDNQDPITLTASGIAKVVFVINNGVLDGFGIDDLIIPLTQRATPPTPVPGVSDYGLYIMAGLFVAAAFLLLRRVRVEKN